ncbi:MAG TPA: DUF2723 domain-containing protein [Acidimicrobiales bacterium]|nr:DUF2723 domain-containing protein [Acidimicrobiales bacterium]
MTDTSADPSAPATGAPGAADTPGAPSGNRVAPPRGLPLWLGPGPGQGAGPRSRHRLRPSTALSAPGDRRRARTIDRLVTVAVVVVTGAVYLRSLLPGVGYSGDTAKFQLLGVVGGVPHATGYPLYVFLDQAFHHLVPWGTSAWRANLLSAVFGAAAIAVLYRLLRTLDVRAWVAAATALTFAFTTTFWSQAVVAEVYTLHILLTVSVAAGLARWRLGASNAWLLGGLGLYALSFGHHLTTGLALPAVAWIVLSDRRRALTRGNVAFVAGAVVVGAAQYLYLLYMDRVGGYVEYPVENLGDIVTYVTGGPFKDAMFAFTPHQLVHDRLPEVWRFLREEYLVLLAPVAYGLVRALRRPLPAQRAIAVYLVLLGLASAFYAMNFDVLDVLVFFLPFFLVLAVFLGLGLEGIVAGVQRHAATRGATAGVVAAAVVVAVAAIPVVTGLVDHPRSSQRGNVADAARIERAIDAAGHHAVFVTDNYQDSEFLWYHVLGEGLGRRRDLVVSNQLTTDEVVTYFEGGDSRLTTDAATLADPGIPRVLTATRNQARALRQAGLHVVPVARGVWEIIGLH